METSYLLLIQSSLPLLFQGAVMTTKILLAAGTLSSVLGFIFGVCTSRELKRATFSSCIEAVMFILRAVPFYVQLLLVYFVLPDLLGIDFDVFNASWIALGICSSGYVAQAIRAGINSIAKEQWEAAKTLGYSTTASIRYIIFPQMIRNSLPALTNELDAMVKSTAILSSIGLLELTRMGMNIVSRQMEPLFIYSLVAAFYVAISGFFNLVSRCIERRLSYDKS